MADKTLEQLQAEAEAAQKALAERQEAERVALKAKQDEERRAAHEAKQEQERVAWKKQTARIWDGIEEALRSEYGHKEVVRNEHGVITEVDGVQWIGISLNRERSRLGGYRSVETNKVRVTVGDYGDRQSFPEKKDGSHSYSEIARRVSNTVKSRIAQAKSIAQTAANGKAAQSVASRVQLGGYGDVTVSPSPIENLPVYVRVEFTRAMTEDDAVALIELLKARGIGSYTVNK